jgi:uncharacterized membrane protein YhaH (DUF805 family)
MDYYLKALKNYAVLTGRSRRKEYWLFVLFNMIFSFLVGIVDGFAGTFDEASQTGIFSSIYALAVIIPSIAVAVRRMHDVGKSGWYILIPIYNFILVCTDGDSEDNEYGSNPKKQEELV